MTDRDRDLNNVIELPQLRAVSREQLEVAALVLVALGTLYGIRKGMKGIGPIELSGSTINGVEFAAFLVIIGTAARVTTIHFPDTGIGRAINFIY